MKNSTEDFAAPAAGSCEAFQWEISQALDERGPCNSSTQEHLQTCPHCSTFAENWGLAGTLAGLLAQPPVSQPALAERIIQTALVASEPAIAERPRRSTDAPWLRWAAVLAMGTLGWWLLDPKTTPPSAPATTGSVSPTLAMNRQAARLKEPMLHEQAALQGAATDGLSRLREIFDWSAGVLQ